MSEHQLIVFIELETYCNQNLKENKFSYVLSSLKSLEILNLMNRQPFSVDTIQVRACILGLCSTTSVHKNVKFRCKFSIIIII